MNRSTYSLFAYCLAVFFPCLFATQLAAQEDSARVQVILVKAGDSGEGIDSGLRPYAGTLQRLFRFKSYEEASRKTVRLSGSGEESLSLTGGQSLSLKSLGVSGRGLKADIEWSRGGKRLLHTRINLQPGRPAVLGGPRSKEDTWLLILVLK